MRTRAVFTPGVTPRLSLQPPASEALTGATSPDPNPYLTAIPTLVFDETGQLRNIGAVVTALKAATESLAGQRGDRPNRAVIFKDLVDLGVLSLGAIASPHGGVGAPMFRLPRMPKSRRRA